MQSHNHRTTPPSPAARLVRIAGFVLLAVALVCPSRPVLVLAAPGDLDPTFGTGGKVTTDFFTFSDAGQHMAIQPDGKIVVAGFALKRSDDASGDFAVARYNPDGSLDTTFGTGGKVLTDFFGKFDEAEPLAIQSDGKIVLAGYALGTNFDFALARYNPDGTLDSTFGGDGKVTTDIAHGDDFIQGLAIQPDGKIVAAGTAAEGGAGENFAVARYNPDGTLDTSFAGDGTATTDFFGRDDEIEDVALQADGKIVGEGFAFKSSDIDVFALARFNTDGSLDASFGTGGKVTTQTAGFQGGASGIAIQADGKVVVGGSDRVTPAGEDFAIARYNPDGSLDTTFGTGGLVTTDMSGQDDDIEMLVVQANGKIVAVGNADHDTDASDFGLARYNPDGSLDTSFGTGGKITTDFFGLEDGANYIALQADGKIVAAGFDHPANGGHRDFALARYEGDPVNIPDFTLSIDPSTITAARRQKGTITVMINRTGGFEGEVTVTAPDTRAIKVKLTPASQSTTGDSVAFSYKVKKKARPGSYDLVFTGRDADGHERTATLTLVIQ